MAKKSQIKLTLTERGFARGEFTDLYDEKCSIQESSLATDYCIWLGMDEAPEPKGPLQALHPPACRMHLNRKQVAALLPLLQHFVETGRLPEVKTKKKAKEAR